MARAVGIDPLPWQDLVVRDMLGERPPVQSRRHGSFRPWAAFEAALVEPRQNGKGGVLEIVAVGALTVLEERLILWSAHETKTAFEAFRRMDEILSGCDDLRRRVARVSRANGDEGFELRSGARLRFVARSKGSGRGFSCDRLILDEAQAIEAPMMDAMLPTLATRRNPQVIYTGTPPLDGRGPAGTQLYRLRDRAVQDPRGLCYLDYGAGPTLEELRAGAEHYDLDHLERVPLDDRELWRSTNPSIPALISMDHVERERGTLDDIGFARERLCIWPKKVEEAGSGIIDPDQWDKLADPESAHGPDVTFALDVSPTRSHAAIVAYGLRQDGAGHAEIVDYRPGTDWIRARLRELRMSWNPIALALDSKGPAGSLLDGLHEDGWSEPEDADEPARGDLAISSTTDLGQACGQLVDAVVQGKIHHIGQIQLTSAIRNAKTRPLGDGAFGWGRKVSSVDVSPLVALTLARWAYVTRAPVVHEADYDVMASVG